MRVVSMVPSWTETLLECGIDVVGRTRFCIHPQPIVRSRPVCGGTKDIDWDKVRALKPDLLLLDREENPERMATESPVPWLATHVTSIADVGRELQIIAEKISDNLAEQTTASESSAPGAKLRELATRWKRVTEAPALKSTNLKNLPGVIEWLKEPDDHVHEADEQRPVVYVIWREPWMAVTRETFIASVLAKAGIPLESIWPASSEGGSRYPQFDLEHLPEKAILLFSSEPYPFLKKRDQLKELNWPSALVDGESFSWFGYRALRFLETFLLKE